jgi:hypothetical protein
MIRGATWRLHVVHTGKQYAWNNDFMLFVREMIAPADIAVWILSMLLAAFICVLMIIRGQVSKYAALWTYFSAVVVIGLSRMHVILTAGVSSHQYAVWYCFSEVIFTISLYLTVADLYRKIVGSAKARALIRRSRFAVIFLVGVYAIATATSGGIYLFVGFERALSFVSATLAIGLFYPRLWNGRAPIRAYQISFLIGAYFLFMLSDYSIRTLYPRQTTSWWNLAQFALLLFPVGVAYVFSNAKSPDDVPTIRL